MHDPDFDAVISYIDALPLEAVVRNKEPEEFVHWSGRQRTLVEMSARSLDILVIGREADVEYITGVPEVWVATKVPVAPIGVLVRATGELYLSGTADEVNTKAIGPNEVYGLSWDPTTLVGELQNIAGASAVRRVGFSTVSPKVRAMLPNAFPNAEFVEGNVAIHTAQEIQTPDEIASPLTDGKKQASVVASNLVTFADTTPVAVRNDVGHWTLFAQLAASNAVPNRDEVREWMDFYIKVLTTTGWEVAGDIVNETTEEVVGSTVHEKILALAVAALGPIPSAVNMVALALNALQGMNRNSPWIRLFNRRAEDARSCGLQIADCEADDAGAVTLRGVEFLVEAHQRLTQFLFFRFASGDARLYQRTRTLRLSAENRQKYSAAVAQKILDRITDNILSFDV
ncbi:aminopeptidase P family N-terminal domain-containing protein [Mycolicibacterium komossense]|uniref:Aminopeptidase P family N-terminal domain-containing protein n=1 Tax=Mycolicibacterium komossense TaxID=1779 RepID=A0ABT3CB19_9MYCO|nr:aminopeptidase P family N-terminal domain-containing protein [Mycolicibacterium komossense]MCV7226601.1 aminopeptidase P family N-terminal domain-containing protein [Mycolicibacterium komossense]